MANKTLKQTVENIESIVKDIAFEMKGEIRECKCTSDSNTLPTTATLSSELSTEDLKKIIVVLNNCIYPTNGDLTSEQRSLLYDFNNDVSWKIADILDMDMNDYYYDIETLELKKY